MYRTLTSFRSLSTTHGRFSNQALEGSSDKNLPKKSSRVSTGVPTNFHAFSIFFQSMGRETKNGLHVILTLDPNKFAEKKQKRLNLDNLQSFRPHVSLFKQSSLVMAPRMEYDISQEARMRTRRMYPPDTKAFLYYFNLPENPRIAGELRLRVTSSDDPASFESGSDLLRTNGRTWSRTLYGVSKYYIPLYKKLREELIVPDDLDAALSSFPSKNPLYRQGHFLYTLNDTFIINFGTVRFFVITEQGMENLPFDRKFYDARKMYNTRPYTGAYTIQHLVDTPILIILHEFAGSVLARFERSTLPEHKGTRTVVLRFLKIITPVKCVIPHYDDHVCYPKEGELFRRIFPRFDKINHQVWSVNIDTPLPVHQSHMQRQSFMQRGLQLLWDA